MNHELAQKALENIKADPKTFNQEMWATKTDCGTAYCFAGHVVHAAYPEAVVKFYDDEPETNCFMLDGVSRRYKIEATELLKIDGYFANELFDVGNSIEDLERLLQ